MQEAASAALATPAEAFIPTRKGHAETMEKEAEWLSAEIVELQARVFALERILSWSLAYATADSPGLAAFMEGQLKTAEMVSERTSEPNKLMAQTHFRGLELCSELLRSSLEHSELFHERGDETG